MRWRSANGYLPTTSSSSLTPHWLSTRLVVSLVIDLVIDRVIDLIIDLIIDPVINLVIELTIGLSTFIGPVIDLVIDPTIWLSTWLSTRLSIWLSTWSPGYRPAYRPAYRPGCGFHSFLIQHSTLFLNCYPHTGQIISGPIHLQHPNDFLSLHRKSWWVINQKFSWFFALFSFFPAARFPFSSLLLLSMPFASPIAGFFP